MTYKSPDQIRAAFVAAGVDLAAPLTTTCGSGITACAVALGAYLIGKDDVQLYDGSWLEWGADPGLPLETGAAR
jgi:thiosulfate/3-mercaptopyruvate sulfurtransferase